MLSGWCHTSGTAGVLKKVVVQTLYFMDSFRRVSLNEVRNSTWYNRTHK